MTVQNEVCSLNGMSPLSNPVHILDFAGALQNICFEPLNLENTVELRGISLNAGKESVNLTFFAECGIVYNQNLELRKLADNFTNCTRLTDWLDATYKNLNLE